MNADPDIPDSLTMHLNGENELVFSRQILHAGIIKELLEQHGSGEEARADFTAGGPASGKSGLIDFLRLAENAVVIDVDLIRHRLPEYATWLQERPEQAAVLTQREASDIAQRAFAAALQDGQIVVFDGVGGNDAGKFTERIGATLAQTHRVRVFYATVPTDVALQREEARYQETGRRVPREYLINKHAEVSRGFPDVVALSVEHIAVYDMTGDQPQLLAHGPGGTPDALEVVDPAGYADFLRKGQA
jgi:predicted kinase